MTEGPVPGWYPDPQGSGRLRWWDGRQWTAAFHPPAPGAPTDGRLLRSGQLRPVGDWFAHIFRLLGDRAGHLFTIASVTLLPLTAAALALLVPAVDGVDLIVTDEEVDVVGWSSSATVLCLVAAGLLILASLAFTTAGQHQMWAAAIGRPSGWRWSLRQGLVALPRLIGWSLVLLMVAIGIIVIVTLVGAAVPVLVLLVVPAVLVGVVFFGVALQFLSVTVVATSENALTTALSVVRGRWWAVLGRTLLAALVGMAASFAFAFVGQLFVVLIGVNAEDVVESSGATDVLHLGELLPNVGAAIVLGIVYAMQAGVSQAVTMASLGSMYADVGGPSDTDRAGVADPSPAG